MAELKDSGNRREFETGAVRDMQEGKGRMDLIPWGVCSDLYDVMRAMFDDGYIGFIPDKEHDGRWINASISLAYPKILVEMDQIDFTLNPSYHDNAMTSTGIYEKIKSRFLCMAAIFCLHHWNLIAMTNSIDKDHLKELADQIVDSAFGSAMLEVGKHYEDGARKYSENNWRKGMDVKIYFDSAARHLMKFMANWTDEPHDRAFLWNCLCGAWECDEELHKIHSAEVNTYSISPMVAAVNAFNDLANSIHGMN